MTCESDHRHVVGVLTNQNDDVVYLANQLQAVKKLGSASFLTMTLVKEKLPNCESCSCARCNKENLTRNPWCPAA